MSDAKMKCPACGWTGDEARCAIVGLKSHCPACAAQNPWILSNVERVEKAESDTAPPPLSGKGLCGTGGSLGTAVQCPECSWSGVRSECMPEGLTCPQCFMEGKYPQPRPIVPAPTGIEAMVCADIAARQRMGIKKYGKQLSESTDDMLKHAYEEALDLACYLKTLMEQRRFADEADTAEARLMKSIFEPDKQE